MTCETFTEALSAWIDGTLSEESARAMRAHADGCAACGPLERGTRDVVARLRDLPREEPTGAAVWEAIQDRIRREPAREERARSEWTRWLSAAAVLAIVAAGALFATRVRERGAPRPTATPVASVPSIPPVLATADATLLEARSALDEVLAARRTNLSPETVRTLTTSLAEMESATRKIRDALAKDPENRALQQMLVASHRRQLSVMRDVTLLAARQDKTIHQEARP